ncbi:unnamed protein product [Prorocentrum cordatum]|uniref:Uncharacterized protein n=1 Tax=Prorocentrum cordatum TaxID=2364126 RepID=A0ABN9W3T5_9DINO|nr:unnamed protein product [Polarella glacialis]
MVLALASDAARTARPGKTMPLRQRRPFETDRREELRRPGHERPAACAGPTARASRQTPPRSTKRPRPSSRRTPRQATLGRNRSGTAAPRGPNAIIRQKWSHKIETENLRAQRCPGHAARLGSIQAAGALVHSRARQLERLAAGLGTRLQNRARRETGPTPERETRRDHEKPHPQSQNRGFAGDSKIGYSSMVLAEGKMRTSERCQDKAATICDRRGPGLATVEPPGAPEHAWPTP